jgi:hypothetical protein
VFQKNLLKRIGYYPLPLEEERGFFLLFQKVTILRPTSLLSQEGGVVRAKIS